MALTLDAWEIVAELRAALDDDEQRVRIHQSDESFVAVDAQPYELLVKLESPTGCGEHRERLASTAELQPHLNRWMAFQRELGRLVALRLVITPLLKGWPRAMYSVPRGSTTSCRGAEWFGIATTLDPLNLRPMHGIWVLQQPLTQRVFR
jgi:hypothetical protein